MKNPELFHKTISILVKAYQKETLRHGECSACAVGNLVASAIGEEPLDHIQFKSGTPVRWGQVFMTVDRETQLYFPSSYFNDAKKQIDATGYELKELMAIEKAFETVEIEGKTNDDQHQFDGLMAVVDALMIIHEANEEEVKEAKLLFVK